jgi:hypothetical protein
MAYWGWLGVGPVYDWAKDTGAGALIMKADIYHKEQ